MSAIVCALPEEAAPLCARLDVGSEDPATATAPDGLRTLRRGRLAGHTTLVAVTGDGRRSAEHGICTLLSAHTVDRLLVIGVSGGLSPGLRQGDVVVARSVRLDGGPWYRAPDAAVSAALAATDAAAVTAVTARSLVTDVAAKAALRDRHGAAVDVVDLESAHYVAAAESAGVPWLVVRAVSDAADEALPGFLEACVAGDGAVDRGDVARYAATHPWVVPGLLSLRARVRRCAVLLADAAERVLEAWPRP